MCLDFDNILSSSSCNTSICHERHFSHTCPLYPKILRPSEKTKFMGGPGTRKGRFFIVELEPYTYEQFCEITNELLLRRKVGGDIAGLISAAVWNKSRDIRDCVRIGAMAKSIDDVRFLVDTF